MRQAGLALFMPAMVCIGAAALVVLLKAPGDCQSLDHETRSIVTALAAASIALIVGATACQALAAALPG